VPHLVNHVLQLRIEFLQLIVLVLSGILRLDRNVLSVNTLVHPVLELLCLVNNALRLAEELLLQTVTALTVIMKLVLLVLLVHIHVQLALEVLLHVNRVKQHNLGFLL